tara:strand:+ start:617 stop:868 length:252 start_codon:yes stop_codon:yes gene_type:complete
MSAICVTTVHATEYAKSYETLEVFDAEGMDAAPRSVTTWLMIMLASFAAGLLFFWRHPIARWVVVFFVAGIIALQITSLLGMF